MKGTGRISAILCVLLYLAAVVGFDVHFCGDDGRVYVEPLFAGISCETIHPDSPCHHFDCGCCDGDEDCCSDSIAILQLTGDGSDCAVVVPGPFAVQAALLPELTSVPVRIAALKIRASNPHDPPPPALSRLCVLRV